MVEYTIMVRKVVAENSATKYWEYSAVQDNRHVGTTAQSKERYSYTVRVLTIYHRYKRNGYIVSYCAVEYSHTSWDICTLCF